MRWTAWDCTVKSRGGHCILDPAGRCGHSPSCLRAQNSNVENLPPHIIRLVYKEVRTLTTDPPDGIKVFPNEEDLTDLQVTIEGPGECGNGRGRGALPRLLVIFRIRIGSSHCKLKSASCWGHNGRLDPHGSYLTLEVLSLQGRTDSKGDK